MPISALPGVLPYITHIGMCRPTGYGMARVWFSRFGLKTGIDFVHFGLESGMVFEEIRRIYEHICRKKGQDLENRAVHPHQEFLGVPPGQH